MGKAGRPILRGKVDKGLGRAMSMYVHTYVLYILVWYVQSTDSEYKYLDVVMVNNNVVKVKYLSDFPN